MPRVKRTLQLIDEFNSLPAHLMRQSHNNLSYCHTQGNSGLNYCVLCVDLCVETSVRHHIIPARNPLQATISANACRLRSLHSSLAHTRQSSCQELISLFAVRPKLDIARIRVFCSNYNHKICAAYNFRKLFTPLNKNSARFTWT